MNKRTEIVVASAILVLVLHTLALSVLASSSGKERGVEGKGQGKGKANAVGVGVYEDNKCSTPLVSIDWGAVDSGSNKNVTYYVRNEGKKALTLSMYTSNWNPSYASSYIALSWDYDGQPIDPNEVVQVTFTLSTSPSVEGIISFSFDFTIDGSR
jgi:hypothetical protein